MGSNPNNTFLLQRNGSQLIVKPVQNAPHIDQPPKTRAQLNVNHIDNKFTLQNEGYKEFDSFFDDFVCSVRSMNLPEKSTDKFFSHVERFVLNCQKLCKNLSPKDRQDEISSIVSLVTEYAVNKLKGRNTAAKRRRFLKSRVSYVEPIESAIGLAWKSKGACGQEIVDHKLIQTTYQYVPILDTLKSLFMNPDFNRMYFDFNENRKHVCSDGIYEDFCCGSIYKQSSFFTKTTLQIQLAVDDFEPCESLKSKKGLHKMCGVYMEVRNIHPELRSKLCNKLLVAMVNTQNLKGQNVSFDNIARRIVSELRILESNGIKIVSGKVLKGALINISADNLGANSIMGFVECFNAIFFAGYASAAKVNARI